MPASAGAERSKPMRVVVIGIGSETHGDDAAGLLVAAELRRMGLGAEVRVSSGDPGELLALWEGADAAILVDAACSGGDPGSVYRFVVSNGPLPAHMGGAASSHSLGVPDAIELGRALGALPATLIVYAIEAEALRTEAPLSKRVARAIERAAQQIAAEVRSLAG